MLRGSPYVLFDPFNNGAYSMVYRPLLNYRPSIPGAVRPHIQPSPFSGMFSVRPSVFEATHLMTHIATRPPRPSGSSPYQLGNLFHQGNVFQESFRPSLQSPTGGARPPLASIPPVVSTDIAQFQNLVAPLAISGVGITTEPEPIASETTTDVVVPIESEVILLIEPVAPVDILPTGDQADLITQVLLEAEAQVLTPRKTYIVAIATNYSGTPAFLPGCEEDLEVMEPLLRSLYGPHVVYIFKGSASIRADILKAIEKVTRAMVPGDRFIVYYSGHGTQTHDTSGDEVDGLDECLLSHDYQTAGLIKDDDLSALWTLAPVGSSIATIFDACNSATAGDIDLASSSGPSMLNLSGCVDTATAASIVVGGTWRGALSVRLQRALQADKYQEIGSLVSSLNASLAESGLSQRTQYIVKGANRIFPFASTAE
jgi:subtilisin family serine protease